MTWPSWALATMYIRPSYGSSLGVWAQARPMASAGRPITSATSRAMRARTFLVAMMVPFMDTDPCVGPAPSTYRATPGRCQSTLPGRAFLTVARDQLQDRARLEAARQQ